jgi:hypothetical protein
VDADGYFNPVEEVEETDKDILSEDSGNQGFRVSQMLSKTEGYLAHEREEEVEHHYQEDGRIRLAKHLTYSSDTHLLKSELE